MAQHIFQATSNTNYLTGYQTDTSAGCSPLYAAGDHNPIHRNYRRTKLTFDFGAYLTGQMVTNVTFRIRIASGLGVVYDSWNDPGATVYFSLSPGSSLGVLQSQNGSLVYINNVPLATEYWLDIVDQSGDPVPPSYTWKQRFVSFYTVASGDPAALIVDYEPVESFIGGSGGDEWRGGDGGRYGGYTGLTRWPPRIVQRYRSAWMSTVILPTVRHRVPLLGRSGAQMQNKQGTKLYVT
jgi:hypothetical protein